MRQVTLRDRWNYAFDNYMTKGPLALILGLAVMAAVVIFIIALLVNVADVAPDDESVLNSDGEGVRPHIGQLAWMGLMRTLDTGTMGGDAGHPGFLLGMLAVTLGGVFTTSMLIGIMSNALQSKLETLRKGRSRVIEIAALLAPRDEARSLVFGDCSLLHYVPGRNDPGRALLPLSG